MPLPSLRRMWIMSKRYPPEQRARAVKMVLDHLDEYRSVYAACQAIGPKVGVGVESLRQWTVQAQIDAQQVPGPTTAERQRIKDLEREVRDLKKPTKSSRPPRFSSRGNSTLATADLPVHRSDACFSL